MPGQKTSGKNQIILNGLKMLQKSIQLLNNRHIHQLTAIPSWSLTATVIMLGLKINLTTQTNKHGIGILLLTKEIITTGIEIGTIITMFQLIIIITTTIMTTKTMLSNLIHIHLNQLSWQIENQLNWSLINNNHKVKFLN
jgi:hypothetical protein